MKITVSDIIGDNIQFVPSGILKNKKITSLKGSAQMVATDFDIRDNLLTSLKDCPISVGGNFICSGNKLKSLDGFPISVDWSIDVSDNPITSLEGIKQDIVKGSISLSYTNITSLEHCPKTIVKTLYCFNTQIKDPLKEIMTHRIKAHSYDFGGDTIYFSDIEKEFNSFAPMGVKVKSKGFRTLLGLDK